MQRIVGVWIIFVVVVVFGASLVRDNDRKTYWKITAHTDGEKIKKRWCHLVPLSTDLLEQAQPCTNMSNLPAGVSTITASLTLSLEYSPA